MGALSKYSIAVRAKTPNTIGYHVAFKKKK